MAVERTMLRCTQTGCTSWCQVLASSGEDAKFRAGEIFGWAAIGDYLFCNACVGR